MDVDAVSYDPSNLARTTSEWFQDWMGTNPMQNLESSALTEALATRSISSTASDTVLSKCQVLLAERKGTCPPLVNVAFLVTRNIWVKIAPGDAIMREWTILDVT